MDESKAFRMLIEGLEGHRRALTDRRRRYTKNLVTQTNEESVSGMPYVVDVAKTISLANGAELFVDQITNTLRTDAQRLGEGRAIRNALASIFERVKFIGSDTANVEVSAEQLYTIAQFIMDSAVSVELRNGDL